MDTASSPSSRKTHPISRWLTPLAVFLTLTAATGFAWQWQTDLQQEAIEAAGNRETAAITAEIREKLQMHGQFLRSVQAFAASGRAYDLDAWHRFNHQIDPGNNLAGLYAFAYAPIVPAKQLDQFVATTRLKTDLADFHITPLRPGERSAPVLFVAPDKPEQREALGFNLLSEPIRRAGIEAATISTDLAMTGPIVLLMDRQSQRTGFMLMKAIYRQSMPLNNAEERKLALDGVVLTAYRLDTFFKSLKHGLNTNFTIRIFDESLSAGTGGDAPPTLIYQNDMEINPVAGSKHYHHEIDFGGRNWVLEFYPVQHSATGQVLETPRLILFGGLASAALLALLVFYLTTHRERAERYALKMAGNLRRSEERFRLASAGSNDGIWDRNIATNEDYISPRMAEIFGFPSEQPPHRLDELSALVAPQDADLYERSLIQHIKHACPLDIQVRINRPDGARGWVRIRGEAVRDASGRATRIAGSITDVTARQQDQEELRHHRDNLQALVLERTASLEEALSRVQAANQAKSEFLANMSHELRTPMHAILSFAELGQELADKVGQDKLRQYCDRIQRSAERLLKLINELLDLSRIDSGQMSLDCAPSDALEIVGQAVAQLESLAHARHIQVTIDQQTADTQLDVDAERLLQVVVNLLGNAIKFSLDAGTIRIELTRSHLPAGRRVSDAGMLEALEIRVIDQGIGIPPEELEGIFDKFVQSSRSKTGAGGTGLGLAISQGIIRQHHGTIAAENNAQGGACFTVTLPKHRTYQ